MRQRFRHHADDGFTLVEILLVVVILAVLASVTAYTVNGLSSRGQAVSRGADEDILTKAQEAYFAQHGTYTTEEGLVSAGLLRARSTIHDILVSQDGLAYSLLPQAAAPTTTSP